MKFVIPKFRKHGRTLVEHQLAAYRKILETGETMMAEKIWRQGDVLIRKLSGKAGLVDLRARKDLKEVKPDRGKTVLAYGEVTGHAHAFDSIQAKLFEGMQEKNKCYLLIETPAELQHFNINTGDLSDSDHAPIAFEPGLYEVIRQREYVAPNFTERVED